MLWNFRFDRTQTAEVLRRLRDEHVLAQGWGGGDQRALRVDAPDFVPECKSFYGLTSTRIPSNLTWMKSFRDGDILVVPHLPTDGKASIHVVDGDFPVCYAFKVGDRCHLNHGIRVKASYGLDGQISIYNHQLAGWYGRLSGLRLPVIKLADLESTFKALIPKAGEPELVRGESKLDEFLQATLAHVLGATKARVREMKASNATISFESLCAHLLGAWGYQVVGRNEYDGAGGDVDLRCVRQRKDSSPFETGEIELFVQVKKHGGTTDEVAVNQLIKMMATSPSADGCVMSLGDNYSPNAIALGQQHGITLMNGDEVCRLLLSGLTASRSDQG